MDKLGGTQASYMEVKDTELHSIGGLAVGQEGVLVEDTAHSPVWGGRFGLGGQGRGVWVYCLVQVPDHTNKTSKIISVMADILTKFLENALFANE